MNYALIQIVKKIYSKFIRYAKPAYITNIVIFTKYAEKFYENAMTSGRKSVSNFR